MPITFHCPSCRQELEAPDEVLGLVVDCPSCSQKVSVPDREASPASGAVRVPPGSESSPPPLSPREGTPVRKAAEPPPLPPRKPKSATAVTSSAGGRASVSARMTGDERSTVEGGGYQVAGEKAGLYAALAIFGGLIFLGAVAAFAAAPGPEGAERPPFIFQALILTAVVGVVMVLAVSLKLRLDQSRILGQAVQVSAQHFAEVRTVAAAVAARLDMACPDIFVLQDDSLNAFAMGGLGKQTVVLHSKLVEKFSLAELAFVLGHEFGHVKFRHTLWLAFMAGSDEDDAGGIPGLRTVSRIVLMYWSRCSELTCDRTGYAGCGDANAALSALQKLFAGPRFGPTLSHEGMVQQKRAMDGDLWLTWSQMVLTHPFTVSRYFALTMWIERQERKNGGVRG